MPPIRVKSMRHYPPPAWKRRRSVCRKRGLGDQTARDFQLPDPLQLASLGGAGGPDRTLSHLCRALVGATAGHLLPCGAVLAGHGGDRLLVVQVLQAGPAQPRALPASRPEPPGAEPL